MTIFGDNQNAICFQIVHILLFPVIYDYNSDVIARQSFKIWLYICLKHILTGLTIFCPNIYERFIVVCHHFLYLVFVVFCDFILTGTGNSKH